MTAPTRASSCCAGCWGTGACDASSTCTDTSQGTHSRPSLGQPVSSQVSCSRSDSLQVRRKWGDRSARLCNNGGAVTDEDQRRVLRWYAPRQRVMAGSEGRDGGWGKRRGKDCALCVMDECWTGPVCRAGTGALTRFHHRDRVPPTRCTNTQLSRPPPFLPAYGFLLGKETLRTIHCMLVIFHVLLTLHVSSASSLQLTHNHKWLPIAYISLQRTLGSEAC